ncbi:MAG TPA: galactose-1-phosphate uridylyltransferase [Actinomycetales bacterium]|nr:galactose-1-phosphate uridylyltransferase [Actinomycetales bacterium]
MNRQKHHLADGREIYFFDQQPQHREISDPRDLPQVATSSQLRFDPLLSEWVIMAGHRQTRTFLPPANQCPLCPSTPQRATEIPAPAYEVAVFENRFPSLSRDAELILDGTAPPSPDSSPWPGARPGVGRCEVVCFTDDHDASFKDLSVAQARLVIDAWADRTAELGTRAEVFQVFPFENRGEEIGVTLQHPHGQIYAYPYITPRTERILASAGAYRERTDRNLFADVLDAERGGERVIVSNEHWHAYVPMAARWPVEVHFMPHRHVGTIDELTAAERDAFAELYLDVLGRFDRLYDSKLPYIAAWHQRPTPQSGARWRAEMRLQLQLFSIRRAADKLKFLAGSESGMDAFVTDVLPEAVAQRLREV